MVGKLLDSLLSISNFLKKERFMFPKQLSACFLKSSYLSCSLATDSLLSHWFVLTNYRSGWLFAILFETADEDNFLIHVILMRQNNKEHGCF